MNIWQWQEKALIEAEFPTGAQIRLTVGAVSSYEVGLYNAYLQEARTLVKERYGVEAKDYVSDDMPSHLAEWGGYHNRAVMLACLLSVEGRESKDSDWAKTELPDEWRNIDTFSRAIPVDLANQWLVEAIKLNPGQFLELPGDDEKKGVRVSSSRLLN